MKKLLCIIAAAMALVVASTKKIRLDASIKHSG
jgi:hypothetical protein